MRELGLFHEHMARQRAQALHGSHNALLRGETNEATKLAHEAALLGRLITHIVELDKDTAEFVKKHLQEK